ncbi:MAG: hypothetical protein N2Z70_01965 [Bdellovibrionaceae bacterium]|jgi:hypothetical protein|nr:hypothetical protein [Pseudobdellovibrionaceae bacterium]
MSSFGYYPALLGLSLTAVIFATSLLIGSVLATLGLWLGLTILVYLWFRKELRQPLPRHIQPMPAVELKHRFSFQSSLLDFHLDPSQASNEFTHTRIWPFALKKHHVTISQQWWEQTPSFYRTIALLYLHEFARALNDSLFWRILWDLRSLFKRGISVTELRPFRKKILKRLQKWHGLDEEWVALFEARYLHKPLN